MEARRISKEEIGVRRGVLHLLLPPCLRVSVVIRLGVLGVLAVQP
jgi:hypothetical protein